MRLRESRILAAHRTIAFADGVVRALEQCKLSKQGGTFVQIGHADTEAGACLRAEPE
jgi:hypothetical protein